MVYIILRALSFLIYKILFRFRAYGVENIPKKGAFILASNHVSYLDPIALGIATSRPLNYMARHDLFFNPAFAWLLRQVRTFPLKRDTADLSAIKKALSFLDSGEPLVLFPEGSRRMEKVSDEPQPGIGFLAAKSGVPVIPACIKGTDEALPKGAKFIKPVKVTVHFGEQILIERGMPYQDIAKLIMERVRHLSCN
ncbi:MAG: 1-acyl-sn-glycerol-3-phosphate acyltransferase [Candidatus Omnitrophica bacterium]|nr:1-acyl-sn-glycerol-3-phosphate acyltransferase [Candidatus Omnitrophota bacterium]